MPYGSLYIVATPIGNLEDITLRALRVLKEVSLVAAEDTRHTQKLLTHFGIHAKLTSYHDHNKEEKTELLIERLKAGESVALVSDAGTPGVSDPGYYLINRAVEEGVGVYPVPGASAALAALMVSGLATDSFTFEGFMPARASQRRKWLEELKSEPRTMIFYEAPHRIHACLDDMLEIFGDRRAVLARELTKLHEEVTRSTLRGIIDSVRPRKLKGEITLLVAGSTGASSEPTVLSLADHVLKLVREKGITKKDAIAKVAKLRGVPKREVYKEALGE